MSGNADSNTYAHTKRDANGDAQAYAYTTAEADAGSAADSADGRENEK